jgi:ATP-dependent exoDNAse (exonuclease V) beta subunit
MKTFLHDPITIENIPAVTQEDGTRAYQTPDGRLYPSVTTVLSEHTKKGIQEWRTRVGDEEANKVSRQAAAWGTRFHTIVEKYLQNNLTGGDMSLWDYEMFRVANPVLDRIDNIRAQEVALWSHHLRLAGRVDCIADFDGKLSVIDFKTARREKDVEHIQHYFMQAAAYAIMFEERTKIPINRLTILIAVSDGFMQVFQSKRDLHVEQLLYYRDMYEVMK